MSPPISPRLDIGAKSPPLRSRGQPRSPPSRGSSARNSETANEIVGRFLMARRESSTARGESWVSRLRGDPCPLDGLSGVVHPQASHVGKAGGGGAGVG